MTSPIGSAAARSRGKRALSCALLALACGGKSEEHRAPGSGGSDGAGAGGSGATGGNAGGQMLTGGATNGGQSLTGGATNGGLAGEAATSGSGGYPIHPPNPCVCGAKEGQIWHGTEACILEEDLVCYATLKETLGVVAALSGGVWAHGCGRYLVASGEPGDDVAQCVFSEDGTYQGAFRLASPYCSDGGTLVTSEDVVTVCPGETLCTVGQLESTLAPCEDPDGAFLAQECADYDRADLLEACAMLGDCPATLAEYLDALGASGRLASTLALVGCGATVLTPDPGYAGGATYTFDETGKLVAFGTSSEVSFGPCGARSYRRGLDPFERCPSGWHPCALEGEAAAAGIACTCPCPENPTDPNVETSLACAEPATGEPCGETLEQELEVLGSWGGELERGCGFTTTTRKLSHPYQISPAQLHCRYDEAGVRVSVVRDEPTPAECAGVTAGYFGEPPPPECPDTAPCWLGPDRPPGFAGCVQ